MESYQQQLHHRALFLVPLQQRHYQVDSTAAPSSQAEGSVSSEATAAPSSRTEGSVSSDSTAHSISAIERCNGRFPRHRASEHGPSAVVERDAGWAVNAGREGGF